VLVRLLIPLALIAAVLIAAATAPAHRSGGHSACMNVSSARSLAATCRR
jgi:hypothetical protein